MCANRTYLRLRTPYFRVRIIVMLLLFLFFGLREKWELARARTWKERRGTRENGKNTKKKKKIERRKKKGNGWNRKWWKWNEYGEGNGRRRRRRRRRYRSNRFRRHTKMMWDREFIRPHIAARPLPLPTHNSPRSYDIIIIYIIILYKYIHRVRVSGLLVRLTTTPVCLLPVAVTESRRQCELPFTRHCVSDSYENVALLKPSVVRCYNGRKICATRSLTAERSADSVGICFNRIYFWFLFQRGTDEKKIKTTTNDIWF